MKLKYFEIEILQLPGALAQCTHLATDLVLSMNVCESVSKRTAGALFAHTHTEAAQLCLYVSECHNQNNK